MQTVVFDLVQATDMTAVCRLQKKNPLIYIVYYLSIIMQTERQLFSSQTPFIAPQLHHQSQRQQQLKTIIAGLTSQIQLQSDLENQKERLTALNYKLVEGLRSVKARHTEEAEQYEREIQKLKEQLKEKTLENQWVQGELRKQQVMYSKKIRILEEIIELQSAHSNKLQNDDQQQSDSTLSQNTDGNTETSPPFNKLVTKRSESTLPNLHLPCPSASFDRTRILNDNNLTRQSENGKLDKTHVKTMIAALIKCKRSLEKTGPFDGGPCELDRDSIMLL